MAIHRHARRKRTVYRHNNRRAYVSNEIDQEEREGLDSDENMAYICGRDGDSKLHCYLNAFVILHGLLCIHLEDD